MKNLKKTLAVVLTLAMVLSMGFSAFAYTDVAEGTKVSEAVGILSNLNILNGFEDGTFKPEETVTRAQMAAIICRTLGYEDQAKSSAGSTIFNDVAADHWAAGYINVAQSLQIINGYGDGNFGPEDQVTYEQAVKMIVVALGYELDAQAKGGYPTGYLAVASREGITKGANGLVGSAAVRGTIAVLVYNSLEVRLMDQETWTTTGKEDEFTKQNDTILSKYLEVQKWEGIVEATPYSKMVAGYKPETEATFDLDTTSSIYREWAYNKLEVYGYAPQATAPAYTPINVKCGDIDVNALAGKKVVAYIGEDAVTGEKILYAIAEKQGTNSSITIGLDQLDESGDKYYTEDGVIGYSAVGSTKSTDIALDDAVKVVENFKTVATWATASAKDTADLVYALTALTGTVTFIDNDGDNKIDVISAIVYDGDAVVKSVSEEDGIITLETYVNTSSSISEDIDTEDDKTLIIVYKDGALASVKDIAANDTISAAKIAANNTFFIYDISSKTVTGVVEGYDTYADTVTIAGEDYKLASGSVASYKNKEGIFFVNTANKIVYADADVAAGNYALVLAAGAGSGVKGGYEVEVVLSNGTSAVYPLHTDAAIVDAAGNVVDIDGSGVSATDETDDAVYAYLYAKTGSVARVTASTLNTNKDDLIYKAKIVNGYIKRLTQVAQNGGSGVSTDEYKEEFNKYGSVKFADSTVIFSVEATGATDVTADKVKVGAVADFFVDGERSGAITGYDKVSGTLGAVIGFGLKETVSQDGAAVIISSVKTISYNDDEAVRINGLQAGKEVSFILYDEDKNYKAANFAKGEVLLIGAADAEGVVASYSKLVKRTVTVDGSGVVTDDNYALDSYVTGLVNGGVKENTTYHFGWIEESAGKTKFNADKDAFFMNNGSSISLEMEKSANYTLVDFTESTSSPEISRKSAGTGIFGGNSTDYESAAFVRIYDDETVEVVVYRWKNAYSPFSATAGTKTVTK